VRAAIDCAGVRAEWVSVPESRRDRTVFYLHGGSFAFRFPNAHAAFAARLCRRLGARALIPDYRLAPEHPFPAATNDSAWLPTAGCWTAVARHTARSSSVTPPAATSRW
jgi:acetyl esterase/lipase